MSYGGTASYRDVSFPIPDLVRRAVVLAEDTDFELCVHPAIGRLLQVLAGGLSPGSIVGETGTGTGAGLAWMVSAADPDVEFVSADIDVERALAAQTVFADTAHRVMVLAGDARLVYDHGPYDLLVFDGGWGSGKTGDAAVDIADVVKPHGVFTVDDFTPMRTWPPTFNDRIDTGRHRWLSHPEVLATEITVAPELAVIVGRYVPGARA